MRNQKVKLAIAIGALVFSSTNFYGQRFHKGKKTYQYTKDGVNYISASWRETLPEQEITSEMHGNSVGKIVFSNEKIPFKNEDASKIKTRLNVSDNIYGRMYLICSIPNDTLYSNSSRDGDNREGLQLLTKKKKVWVTRGHDYYRDARASYRLFINGELSSWAIQNVEFTEESLHHTTRQVWLAPKPEDEPVSRYWLQELDKLPEGEHHVRIEYIPGNSNEHIIRPLAAGEFTLVKSGNATVSTGIKYADLDEARNDPQLAKEVIKVMAKVYKDKGWDGTLTKVKFNTDWESFWSTAYGKTSRVREIRFYAYTTHQSGKCMVEEFTVGQAYNGGEFSGPLFYRRVIPGSKQRIDCE
ncbi:hypothetical protein SAMN03080594_102253 [Arenibacter palladensis]|uniref:Uncharacterized protein n=1 Tax=Arenibacter palladensis TaxID=237373 RepID=A0A1M4XYX5_9FLAO|nr:hypothetical protein [Arenibacter palladensis]SHE98691.1 hypothetical protein SAMN03080594_102253 [Arenibacter palladensis]